MAVERSATSASGSGALGGKLCREMCSLQRKLVAEPTKGQTTHFCILQQYSDTVLARKRLMSQTRQKYCHSAKILTRLSQEATMG